MNANVEPIIDYIVESYGIPRTDIDVTHGGKHRKAKFPFNGKNFTITLPGTPGDPCWLDIKKGDIRRLLGQPIADAGESPRPKRKLDDMTDALVGAAAQIVSLEPSNLPPVRILRMPHVSYPASVALYKSGKSLRIMLSDILMTEFNKDYKGPAGLQLHFTAPDLWTIRHKPVESPKATLQQTGQWLCIFGGASTWERLGVFASTPAATWLEKGVIHVQLTEKPRKELQRRSDRVALPPEPELTRIEGLENAIAHVKDDETAAVVTTATALTASVLASISLDDRLRAALAEIRSIHAETPYRLINVAGEWMFRAVLEVK